MNRRGLYRSGLHPIEQRNPSTKKARSSSTVYSWNSPGVSDPAGLGTPGAISRRIQALGGGAEAVSRTTISSFLGKRFSSQEEARPKGTGRFERAAREASAALNW